MAAMSDIEPVPIYRIERDGHTVEFHDTPWEGHGILEYETEHNSDWSSSVLGGYPLLWQPVACE
jgi:hypothetical protein